MINTLIILSIFYICPIKIVGIQLVLVKSSSSNVRIRILLMRFCPLNITIKMILQPGISLRNTSIVHIIVHVRNYKRNSRQDCYNLQGIQKIVYSDSRECHGWIESCQLTQGLCFLTYAPDEPPWKSCIR